MLGLLGLGVGLGVLTVYRPTSPSPPAGSPSAAREESAPGRLRQPLFLPTAPKGDAFQNFYELAVVNLYVTLEQEKALASWVHQPAAPLTAPITAALRSSSKAFAFFEQGTSAAPSAKRRLNALLAQKAYTLGRLELARGRLELDAGSRQTAIERGFAALRFGQDVIATESPQGIFAGAVVEEEALGALETWLEKPGWRAEDLDRAKALLARVLESVPEPSKASENAARVVRNANSRLASLPGKLENALGRTP